MYDLVDLVKKVERIAIEDYGFKQYRLDKLLTTEENLNN